MKIYLAGEREQQDFKFYANRLFSCIYVLPGMNEHRAFRHVKRYARGKGDEKIE